MRLKVSVVIPFYNESKNLERIYLELKGVWAQSLQEYDLEVILMDNASTDESHHIALKIAQGDSNVKVIQLSRNFGYQANIYTGFMNANGDAVVQLDADGEDDPALIVEFVKLWRAGYEVVYGVRQERQETFWLTFQRKAFYRLLAFLSEIEIPLDAGDFRLLDRKVVTALSTFSEYHLYLRGLISYAGFKQVGLPYKRRARYSGESKFSRVDYWRLAMDGITSFSKKPLRYVMLLGFLFSFLSCFGIVFYLGLYFFSHVDAPGFTTLILVQLFVAGLQLFCIGLLGLYVGRIFDESKNRPRSIIREKFP